MSDPNPNPNPNPNYGYILNTAPYIGTTTTATTVSAPITWSYRGTTGELSSYILVNDSLDTQFIEALITNVKNLMYAAQTVSSKDNRAIKYHPSYFTGTDYSRQPSPEDMFYENSDQVQQFKRNLKTLLEWYRDNNQDQLTFQYSKSIEELLSLSIPKIKKD